MAFLFFFLTGSCNGGKDSADSSGREVVNGWWTGDEDEDDEAEDGAMGQVNNPLETAEG